MNQTTEQGYAGIGPGAIVAATLEHGKVYWLNRDGEIEFQTWKTSPDHVALQVGTEITHDSHQGLNPILTTLLDEGRAGLAKEVKKHLQQMPKGYELTFAYTDDDQADSALPLGSSLRGLTDGALDKYLPDTGNCLIEAEIVYGGTDYTLHVLVEGFRVVSAYTMADVRGAEAELDRQDREYRKKLLGAVLSA